MDDEIPNVTWPRSQLPPKLLQNIRAKNELRGHLDNLRKISEQKPDQETKDALDNVVNLLSRNDVGVSHSNVNKGYGRQQSMAASTMTSTSNFAKTFRRNTMQHQPYFGSMVICAKPEMAASSSSKRSIQYVNGTDGMVVEQVIQEGPKKIAPYAVVISGLTLLVCFVAYILAGTVVFQALDASLGNQTFYGVLFLPFQVTATIGWGNYPVIDKWAQLFCIVYALFGIPLGITTLTQLGRCFFTGFSSDWIYGSGVLRHTPGTVEPMIQFPVIRAANLVVFQILLGIVLFTEFLGIFDIVESFYFIYTAIALIGFGDLSPHSVNFFQSMVICVYLMLGIVFIAVLHGASTYHIQRLFFVIFKNWLYEKHQMKVLKKNLSTPPVNNNTSNS